MEVWNVACSDRKFGLDSAWAVGTWASYIYMAERNARLFKNESRPVSILTSEIAREACMHDDGLPFSRITHA